MKPEALTTITITLTAVLLYFIGWMYLYYFLLSFGTDIFVLDIPFHFFLIYSFSVFSAPVYSLPLAAWQIFSLSVISFVLPFTIDTTSQRKILMLFVSACLLFFYGHTASQSAADHNAHRLRAGESPRVDLLSASGIEADSDELKLLFEKVFKDGAYIILETPDLLVVYIDDKQSTPNDTLVSLSAFTYDPRSC